MNKKDNKITIRDVIIFIMIIITNGLILGILLQGIIALPV